MISIRNSTDLREKVRNYLSENKLSQAKFAQLTGANEGSFSAWLNEKYAGNSEKIEDSIIDFFEKQEDRKKQTTIDEITFTQTEITKKIIGILNYCRVQKKIGCIYGDAGVGKTATATQWAEDKTDAIYITANVAIASAKPFFKTIARKLKINVKGQLDDIYFDIVEKLEITDKTIVIDEAQHLHLKTLELVRNLNDMSKTAIILIGNEKVHSKLTGGNQEADFAQLFSRIGMKLNILTDHFKIGDIKAIFKGLLDDEATRFILDIAKSRYGLRGAINVYINSINNGDINKEGLRAVATTMGIVA